MSLVTEIRTIGVTDRYEAGTSYLDNARGLLHNTRGPLTSLGGVAGRAEGAWRRSSHRRGSPILRGYARQLVSKVSNSRAGKFIRCKISDPLKNKLSPKLQGLKNSKFGQYIAKNYGQEYKWVKEMREAYKQFKIAEAAGQKVAPDIEKLALRYQRWLKAGKGAGLAGVALNGLEAAGHGYQQYKKHGNVEKAVVQGSVKFGANLASAYAGFAVGAKCGLALSWIPVVGPAMPLVCGLAGAVGATYFGDAVYAKVGGAIENVAYGTYKWAKDRVVNFFKGYFT